MWSAFHWLISYLVAAAIAGAVFLLAFFVIEYLQGNSCEFNAAIMVPGHFVSTIFGSAVFISVFAAPSVLFLIALPELLGVKPRVLLWGVLGSLAALTSIVRIFADSVSDIPNKVTKLFSQIVALDPFTLSLVIAGGSAGMVIGYLRRKHHSHRHVTDTTYNE